MKISREGIVLIKSFEGFRPRALRREDGGWVIGYGHTLSAREGASVSEADAELLLRYDLMPVEKSVNHAGSTVLNQHQFDALVSFAFSVGIDRFQGSDVLAHLRSGATGQAADALMGWPEPALPQAALRRRAAERALFTADPDTPVAVSDLLVVPFEPIEAQKSTAPVEDLSASDKTPVEPILAPVETVWVQATEQTTEQATGAEVRGTAVSALLGEYETLASDGLEPPVSVFITTAATPPEADTAPQPANDAIAEADASLEGLEVVGSSGEGPTQTTNEPTAASSTDVSDSAKDLDTGVPAAVEPALAALSTPEQPEPAIDRVAVTVQRYSPYSAPMVGPLPFLQTLPERVAEPAPVTPTPHPAAPPQTAAEDPITLKQPIADTPIIQPFAPPAEVEPLILVALEEAPASAVTRQPWTIDERSPVETSSDGLFGEDMTLTMGGAPVMRHGDIEFEAPASFDWSETGAFIIMGAVGLTAFGAAMAAFRLASEQSGGNETTIIAWVLAIIGAACVGISSFNLYRRWGLPGGEN